MEGYLLSLVLMGTINPVCHLVKPGVGFLCAKAAALAVVSEHSALPCGCVHLGHSPQGRLYVCSPCTFNTFLDFLALFLCSI